MFVFLFFIDRKLIHNLCMSIQESFPVPWYQIKILVRVIWGSKTHVDYYFYCNLIIFFQYYLTLSNCHNNGMLKWKMIVHKNALTTEYWSIGAPKIVNYVPEPILKCFNHFQYSHLGISTVQSFYILHIHHTCIIHHKYSKTIHQQWNHL